MKKIKKTTTNGIYLDKEREFVSMSFPNDLLEELAENKAKNDTRYEAKMDQIWAHSKEAKAKKLKELEQYCSNEQEYLDLVRTIRNEG